ncbi:MAG: small-conductance mechanosensitive channel [Myxococcota bacterium]|jgi:small-conductance mechanosensitive channel
MNLISMLNEWWPASTTVLLTISGVEITVGGLLLLCVMALLGLLVQKPGGRLAVRLAKKRGLEDERVLSFIGELAGVIVLLVMIGIAMDMGRILTFGQFTDAIFGLLNFSLFQIASTPISLTTIAIVAVVMLVTSWLSRIIQAGVRRTTMLRLGHKVNDATLKAIERLIHYLVLMLGLGVGLQTAGINLSALFTAGAVFAVGIGFAMQNIAQNFVSGVIVLAEQVIRPGDVLEIDGQVVQVEEMGIRSTVVRSLNEEYLIVPNSLLAQNTVKNFSLRSGNLRVRVLVGVAYESDLKAVEQTLAEAALKVGDQVDGRLPRILLHSFGSSSVDYEVSIWVCTPWDHCIRASELRQAIWWGFKEAGITISFPQIDVHFDAPVTESLRLVKPEE